MGAPMSNRSIARRLSLMALVLGAALASQTAEARSDRPRKDSGRVDVGPGWRYEPLRGSNSFGGGARFGYQIDSRWSLGVEVGFWMGRVDAARLGLETEIGAESLSLMVGDLRFAIGIHLLTLGPAWIYGLGGGGYHLVGVSYETEYREGATQGLFVGAGACVPLSDRLGLFVENRYTFLTRIPAEIGGELPLFDAGGNLLWAGLVVFFEPSPRPSGLGGR